MGGGGRGFLIKGRGEGGNPPCTRVQLYFELDEQSSRKGGVPPYLLNQRRGGAGLHNKNGSIS